MVSYSSVHCMTLGKSFSGFQFATNVLNTVGAIGKLSVLFSHYVPYQQNQLPVVE